MGLLAREGLDVLRLPTANDKLVISFNGSNAMHAKRDTRRGRNTCMKILLNLPLKL